METNGQESRVMYLCFLAHYYLELQQGEKAIKVLEGVLHIFPNSHIAASQVCKGKDENEKLEGDRHLSNCFFLLFFIRRIHCN